MSCLKIRVLHNSITFDKIPKLCLHHILQIAADTHYFTCFLTSCVMILNENFMFLFITLQNLLLLILLCNLTYLSLFSTFAFH